MIFVKNLLILRMLKVEVRVVFTKNESIVVKGIFGKIEQHAIIFKSVVEMKNN